MRRNTIICLILAVVLVMFSSCLAMNEAKVRLAESTAVFDTEYDGEVLRDLRYGDAPRNVYDLYLPEDTAAAGASHLILFIHGGSWTSGDKEDGEPYCRNFAAHGYVAASICYTLKAEGADPTILSINGEVKEAVSAIKDKCAELGIGLTDMAVSGFSAGACQAMMYGFTEATTSALPVKFIIQMSGPTTFDPYLWSTDEVHWLVRKEAGLDGTPEGAAKWISLFSGENVTAEMVKSGEAESIWKNISPFYHITAQSIPVLSAYGSLDGVVPPTSRIVLENALEASGKVRGQDFDTVILKHSGHALACDVDELRILLAKIYDYCDRYFD